MTRVARDVDRETFEFLGFAFIGEGDEAELASETFIDNTDYAQNHHYSPATANRV